MGIPVEAQEALAEIARREDPDVLAVFVSGSAARGMANEHSDVDVYVVLTQAAAAGRTTVRGRWADEIPTTLAELEAAAPLGTDAWWYRWSFAWVDVLRDDTGGRLAAALRTQCTLTGAEQRDVLVDRLDGYLNFAFRALKADRDGRPLERRLDAAESVPWLLDTVFALAGRVRPYNKYLGWELRTHPLTDVLDSEDWSAGRLLPVLEQMLDGDPSAVRRGFRAIERQARAWDAQSSGALLGDTIDSWGEHQLGLLRNPADPRGLRGR